MTLLLNNYTDYIEKPINLKVEIDYNIRNIIMSQTYVDYFVIPEHITTKLKSLLNIEFTKFIPNISLSNNMSSDTIKYFIQNKIENIIMPKNVHIDDIRYLYNMQQAELKSFIGNFEHELHENIGNINNDFHYIIDNNFNIIISFQETIFISLNNVLIVIPNKNNTNDYVILSNDIQYIKKDNFVIMLKVIVKDETIIMNSSYEKINHKTQELSICLNKNGTILKCKFRNQILNTKLNQVVLKNNNGDIYDQYNKNNIFVKSAYNNTNKTKHLISQCMINDPNSGLHFRGKYSETSKDGKIFKKVLSKDDEIIYDKEENTLLLDKISNKNDKKDGLIIGWKVAKSILGELRIVKLAIPNDATTVLPIDSEYFATKGKERCNKAIVMDIQLADRYSETSIVPEELVAYSYIFTENGLPFEYKVGQEIFPDSFDNNENESCTHGIHYYQNREKVFDVYIDK